MRAGGALVAALALPMSIRGIDLGPVKVSGSGFAEFRSAYYSRGNIVRREPVLPFLGHVTGYLGKFGHIGGGVFAMSALTPDGQSGDIRQAFNEVDPKVYYGYNWDFGGGWALENAAGYMWVLYPGYRAGRPTRHEWHIGQNLKNPYVTPYYLWRHAFEGAKWNYWQVGLNRAFPLGCGFVLKPKFWCDFGDANLFRVQYGRDCTDCLMALNGELRLEWWLVANFALHAAVQQFGVVSATGREALDASPREQATKDLTIFIAGLTAKF